jgi:hypothetical protein
MLIGRMQVTGSVKICTSSFIVPTVQKTKHVFVTVRDIKYKNLICCKALCRLNVISLFGCYFLYVVIGEDATATPWHKEIHTVKCLSLTLSNAVDLYFVMIF